MTNGGMFTPKPVIFSLSSYLEPQFLTKIHLHFITKCVTYCKAAHNVNIIPACWLFCAVFFLNISQYVVWVLTLIERVGKKTSMRVFFVEKPGDFFCCCSWRLVENEAQQADAGFMSEPDADGYETLQEWGCKATQEMFFFFFFKKNLLVITLAR